MRSIGIQVKLDLAEAQPERALLAGHDVASVGEMSEGEDSLRFVGWLNR